MKTELNRYSDLSDKELVLKAFKDTKEDLGDKLQTLITIAKAQESDDISEYIRGITITGKNEKETFNAKIMLQTLAKSIDGRWSV